MLVQRSLGILHCFVWMFSVRRLSLVSPSVNGRGTLAVPLKHSSAWREISSFSSFIGSISSIRARPKPSYEGRAEDPVDGGLYRCRVMLLRRSDGDIWSGRTSDSLT